MAYTLTPAPGTISIAHDSAAITGSGTGFTMYRKGWLLLVPGHGIIGQLAETPTSDTAAVLVDVLGGAADITDAAFQVIAQPEASVDAQRVRQLIDLLGSLGAIGLQPSAVGDYADRSGFDAQDKGYIYMSLDGDGADITAPVLYIKNSATAGDWSLVQITGPRGPSGVIGNWRGPWATGTAYAVHDAVQQGGSSYIVPAGKAHTAGTFATDLSAGKWQLSAAKGDTGATGTVQSIVAGTNVTVDTTDPANPVVSSSGGGGSSAFDTVAALIADTTLGYSTGTVVTSGQVVQAHTMFYAVAASAATDHDLTTAGGVKLYLLPGTDGRFALTGLGVASGGDITTALAAFFGKLRTVGVPQSVVIDDAWTISAPIRLPYNIRLYGTNAGVLTAASGLTSITVDVAGGKYPVGTPVGLAPMLWCAETAGTSNIATIGATPGTQREGLHIDRTVRLNCNFHAEYGLFIDNIQNSYMAPRIENASLWCVRDYWMGWGNRHHAQGIDFREGGIWIGDGCNGVDMSGAQLYGLNDTPTAYHVLLEGNLNGISVRLGYLEKGLTAVYCRAGTGPIVISGVDIEVMSAEAIVVDGTGVTGRLAGPVTIEGCFLETSGTSNAVVKSINAVVRVVGCRIRNKSGASASGLFAFSVSGGGVIYDEGNTIDSTIGNLNVPGVVSRSWSAGAASEKIMPTNASTSISAVYTKTVQADPYAASMPLSTDKVEAVVFDSGAQQTGARRSLLTTIQQASTVQGTAGLVVDCFGGSTNLTVRPPANNTNALGNATYQWKTAYLVSAAVVSSDRRLKNVLSETIPEALLDAWPEHVHYGVYTWRDEIDGGRKRTGLFAQDIIAAFEEAGIDWREWAIIETDAEGFFHVVKDEAQAIENAVIRRAISRK